MSTVAVRRVCRKEQALAYCKVASKLYHLKRYTSSFQFGGSLHNSEGMLELKLTIADDGHVAIEVDEVDTDVPLNKRLTCLNDLKREKLLINDLDNKTIPCQSHTKRDIHSSLGIKTKYTSRVKNCGA